MEKEKEDNRKFPLYTPLQGRWWHTVCFDATVGVQETGGGIDDILLERKKRRKEWEGGRSFSLCLPMCMPFLTPWRKTKNFPYSLFVHQYSKSRAVSS